MRKLYILIFLLMAVGLMAQAQDSLGISFAMPQNMDPAFDYFSVNYVGAQALGRGNSGVALKGEVESILVNPAAYHPQRSAIYGEMLIKPPVKTDIYHSAREFSSPVPFGMIAAGGPLENRFLPGMNWGVAYSLPKSIVLDAFVVPMNFGAYEMVRYPIYNQHQLTANLGWHRGDWNVGVNLHNQIHYISDFTVLRTFEHIREYKYLLRPELGVLWTNPQLNVGLSITPPSRLDWKLKYLDFDTTMPTELTAGIAIKNANQRYIVDAQWENASAVHEDYKDRFSLKAGFESDVRSFTYRVGYLYRPEIWHGSYNLPINTTADADTALWWNYIPTSGSVSENGQHLVSAGISWAFKYGVINVGGMIGLGQPDMAQVSASLGLYTDYFRRKRHPAEL
ncbi:MAG: hypothetical protein GX122_02410 [Candidatus Cloacimonetes bacterium]|nr:hypothetical protein [Candidatus Cloacimonadota bacterium]